MIKIDHDGAHPRARAPEHDVNANNMMLKPALMLTTRRQKQTEKQRTHNMRTHCNWLGKLNTTQENHLKFGTWRPAILEYMLLAAGLRHLG